MDFTGKRVLVTGGAQGLGRATVQKFYEAGATVTAVDVDSDALKILKVDFPNVTTSVVDLLDWNATTTEIEKLGPFDHLVNNAGILRFGGTLGITEDDIDLTFGINFKAALHVAQIFAKGVIAAGIKDASIVNISSVADTKFRSGNLVYACSKGAVTRMTKCLALELSVYGIRVNCIRPTAMKTNIFATAKHIMDNYDEAMQKLVADSPIPRLVEPSEAADLILFLCSPRAAMITGEGVGIDGGRTIM